MLVEFANRVTEQDNTIFSFFPHKVGFFCGGGVRRDTTLRSTEVQCLLWVHIYLSEKVSPLRCQPVPITKSTFFMTHTLTHVRQDDEDTLGSSSSWDSRTTISIRRIESSTVVTELQRRPIIDCRWDERLNPRIVTNKQHRKHTWMRHIVLSIHSFINIPITLLSPVQGLNPSGNPLFHESFLKNNIQGP